MSETQLFEEELTEISDQLKVRFFQFNTAVHEGEHAAGAG